MNRILKALLVFVALASQSAYASLYVGTNYHPHDDKNIEKIRTDIRLMKDAGFNVVRMGHLAWDSYEPEEGVWDFEWFDTVMDLMAENGIKVILDIATRPAPLWLHHKYPEIDITDAAGTRLYPNHRYLEDVGNPDYQRYALLYTDVLTKRYGSHPALLAFGVDNEPGDGPISYSDTVKQRFISWLKDKYQTLPALNSAWASQRWSRKINAWDEIGLPQSGSISGAPERMLDFRRFISDEINGFYGKMLDVINKNAPKALTTTNAWYYSALKYFDYAPIAYSGKMSRQGFGFYPGNSLKTYWGVLDNLFGITRIQFENDTPFWCTEFTTMTAVPGSMRRAAYATLFYGGEMVCGWTWQSMHGGEEQYLQGMLDWDGVPNRKYDEYARFAHEFQKIAQYFPYQKKSEVALAYNFESQMATQNSAESHDRQVQTAFNPFMRKNLDVNMMDIRYSDKQYKLIVIPGLAVVDSLTATKIRNYVANGGVAIMTSGSAMLDETGKVFSTTRPGRLHDVFGIRLGGIEETATMNELADDLVGNQLKINFNGQQFTLESSHYDVIEMRTAKPLATITNFAEDVPVATINHYGKGVAIYLGIPASETMLDATLSYAFDLAGITPSLDVPQDVMAREIRPGMFLYLNNSGETKTIRVGQPSRSLLYDKSYGTELQLPPYEVDFIELTK